MDQKNIGEYICKKRKLNNLTQKELALMLHVSEKTVSKWETGNGLPEISNMKLLCEILDISLIDLLNGDDNKDEKKYIEYVEHENNKKNQIIKGIIITFFIIIFGILAAFFIGNYNRIVIFELNGESEHFSYNNGLLMKSNIKNLLISGDIEIKDNYILESEIKSISLYADKEIIIKKSNMEFNDYYLENYGYDEILTDKKINNIDNWFIKIEYVKNNVLMTEKIDVKNYVTMKNNKILSFKSDKISTDNEKDDSLENKKINELIEFLNNNSYTKISENTYKKNNIEIVVRNNVYISNFYYQDDEYSIKFNPYTGNYTFVDKKDYSIYSYYKNSNSYYYNDEICSNVPQKIVKYYESIENQFKKLEK